MAQTALLPSIEHLRRLQAVAFVPPRGWRPPEWLHYPIGGPTLPMLDARMRWCMDALGWSSAVLARRLDTDDSTVRQWMRGKRGIPHVLALWLEELACNAVMQPRVPDTWQSRQRSADDLDAETAPTP